VAKHLRLAVLFILQSRTSRVAVGTSAMGR
jgi:hypothetical protein